MLAIFLYIAIILICLGKIRASCSDVIRYAYAVLSLCCAVIQMNYPCAMRLIYMTSHLSYELVYDYIVFLRRSLDCIEILALHSIENPT